ncbi:MAG: SPOR domain-containing protein, partial [Spirochaetaceae bacterium]|nr:SPOR domain-containing protein [Spirochaetaceae bacterium]
PVPPALPSASDALPKIKQLERGSYYVQLGSFTQKEDIDRTISHLNNNKLPLLIQSAGNGDALRLMIGPMNEGESAALFLRLKNDGYKNIFIRKN